MVNFGRSFDGFMDKKLRNNFLLDLVGKLYVKLLNKRFSSSEEYWKDRYKKGGSSGRGSYSKLAEFKAGVINEFVKKNDLRSVIEFGCGDGNQLELAQYSHYHGFDVSPDVIKRCRELFKGDVNKQFDLVCEYDGSQAELALSLDVIYHLVENSVFDEYMQRLFSAASRYIVVYSSNVDDQASVQAPHVKHRKFTRWIDDNAREWRQVEYIPNRYSYKGAEEGSTADFFVFEKVVSSE